MIISIRWNTVKSMRRRTASVNDQVNRTEDRDINLDQGLVMTASTTHPWRMNETRGVLLMRRMCINYPSPRTTCPSAAIERGVYSYTPHGCNGYGAAALFIARKDVAPATVRGRSSFP